MQNKNESFFKFRDDQDIQSDSEAQSWQEQGNQNLELKQENNKINVHGGIPNDEENPDQDKQNDEAFLQIKKKKSLADKAGKAFLTILLSFFFNITILYPLLILISCFLFLQYLFTCCCNKITWKQLISPIIVIIVSFSIIMVNIYAFKAIFKSDDVYSMWYFDSFILFISHIMIFSMVQMTKQNSFELKLENVCTIKQANNIGTLVFNINNKIEECETLIDIPRNQIQWEYEYKRILGNKFEVELDSQRFNTFANNIKHPDIQQYIGYQLLRGFEKPLRPNSIQYYTLQFIMFLKIICSLSYLNYHSQFNYQDMLNVVIITVFSFNEVYCLNIILSNYDLRRKTIMSNNINNAIIIGGKVVDYYKIIDITNSESIETWDNSRRCIYEFFSDTQKSLERSYICLLFYYLIVTNIILAAYGEIYIIISKESFILNPLIVISSTFTFIFLNTLIFFRLYFGSKFNETFEECQDQVENIIGIYQDLIQMYDYNFTQRGITKNDYLKILEDQEDEEVSAQKREDGAVSQNADEMKSNRSISKSRQLDQEKCASQLEQEVNYYTCYDIMISKFMYLSEYYIDKKIEFQGKLYTKEQEKILQQKMMLNCLKSFKRIKQQIIVDAKLQCYQAFNIVRLDFKDTLFTICLGLLTLLPQIITKFIEQFKFMEGGK